jgi:hypothetical protein
MLVSTEHVQEKGRLPLTVRKAHLSCSPCWKATNKHDQSDHDNVDQRSWCHSAAARCRQPKQLRTPSRLTTRTTHRERTCRERRSPVATGLYSSLRVAAPQQCTRKNGVNEGLIPTPKCKCKLVVQLGNIRYHAPRCARTRSQESKRCVDRATQCNSTATTLRPQRPVAQCRTYTANCRDGGLRRTQSNVTVNAYHIVRVGVLIKSIIPSGQWCID